MFDPILSSPTNWQKQQDIELNLKLQLVITSVLTVITRQTSKLVLKEKYLFLSPSRQVVTSTYLAYQLLPPQFELKGVAQQTFIATPGNAAICVCSGCIGGLVIGLVTEYYTSYS